MNDTLIDRARALGLHGLVAHWGELGERDWPAALVAWEEDEHWTMRHRLSALAQASRFSRKTLSGSSR